MTRQNVENEDIDDKIRAALMSERMPRNVAGATLDYIHAHASYIDDSSGLAVRVDTVAAASPESVKGEDPRRPRSRISRRRFIGLMAAAVSTAALASAGVAFAHETASVSVEGASSIDLGLNRWNIVVRYAASNDEIEGLLDELGLRGLSCDEALGRISENAQITALLAREGGIVLVASSNNQKQLDSALESCRAKEKGFGAQTRSECGQGGRGQGKGRGNGAHNRQIQ